VSSRHETTHNLPVDFLLEHDYAVYIVPPQATNAYRNRQRSSEDHTGESDAALLASIMRTDRDSHRFPGGGDVRARRLDRGPAAV
jgi:hypothetical protein